MYADLVGNYEKYRIKSLYDNKKWGWSEMTAAMSVRPYTTNRNYRVLLTCTADTKLTPLKNKCWYNLDWLNTNTNGGLRHVRQRVNNLDTKRASKVDKDGHEFGWMSEIDSVIADSADKIRGDRVDRLVYEECGSNKILAKAWIQGEALTSLGGIHFGTRISLGCVCAGTKVWTKDGRHINIEDLKKEDGIIGFHDGESYPQDIVNINPPAEKECVRIITDFGNLECSVDHPIFNRIQRSKRIIGTKKQNRWYDYVWTRADEIDMRSKRSVIGICDKIDVWGSEKLFDPYLVGALIGDGTYGINKTPVISNCDDEVINYVENKYNVSNNIKPRLTKDGKIYRELRIKNITQQLKKLGIYGQTKTAKRLPHNYMSLTKDDSLQLLAGLFDTDGCVTRKGDSLWRIGITQSSREILEQILELLNKFGIYGHIHKQEPRICEGRKDKNPWYNLYIEDVVSTINFAEQIPLKIKYKKERLEKVLENKKSVIWQHYYKFKGIREAHVIEVVRIGKKRIYNLTADGVHTYLANNFITHNTGRLIKNL